VDVGFDHVVKNSDSDPARGTRFGFLKMLSQLRIGCNGAITARLIPARRTTLALEFNPLVVNDGESGVA
jgi:hypothetical protein